jgi:hypothetical protein
MEDASVTYQGDPGRPRNPFADEGLNDNQARRDDEIALRNAEATNTYGIVPIILSLLLLLGVGYFAYTFFSPHTQDASRTTEYTAPRPVTPAPAPAPSSPQAK